MYRKVIYVNFRKELRGKTKKFTYLDDASTWDSKPCTNVYISDGEYTDPEFTAQIMKSQGILSENH